MSIVKTSLGNAVAHHHFKELTQDGIDEARKKVQKINPKAIELEEPTRTFNCHGYSFAISHGWFNYPDLFFQDDYDKVGLSDVQIGDVVVYENGDTLMHSAQIVRVEGSEIKELHSKWGDCALLSHSLRGVPYSYGKAVYALRRRAP